MQTIIHVSNTVNTADYDKYGNSRGNFPGWKQEPWKRSGNAGIFPAENGNRENGRENTPTVPVPVPARFPVLFSHFPIFSAETVYGRFKQ